VELKKLVNFPSLVGRWFMLFSKCDLTWHSCKQVSTTTNMSACDGKSRAGVTVPYCIQVALQDEGPCVLEHWLVP